MYLMATECQTLVKMFMPFCSKHMNILTSQHFCHHPKLELRFGILLMFEDIKEVIRNRKTKKNRKYNGQKTDDKQ